MESVVFMHGSAGGQSTIIPPECPKSICDDISGKYFRGRIARQKKSGTKLSLFVDLYQTSDGEQYCLYSFVNNECFGTDGREGQYFSITVLCKDAYVYPEAVYKMLYSAYNQMCDTGKVIRKNEEGKDQYVIAQFSDQKEYLLKLIEKIGEAFNSIAHGQIRALTNCVSADYDSWNGTKINLDICNSVSTFTEFCECGRIYVSEEYESPSAIIKTLEEKIHRIEQEKKKLEEKIIEAKNTENSRNRKEKEELSEQLRQLQDEIKRLNSENEKYKDSIDIVCKELNKFSKASKNISIASAERPQFSKHSTKELLKTCILLALLILTVISSIVNYSFFRDISIALEAHTHFKDEVPLENDTSIVQEQSDAITIETPEINVKSNGGTYDILISGNSEWSIPTSSVDWIAFEKKDNNHLTIIVSPNTATNKRDYKFILSSSDKQITVNQEGNQNDSKAPVNFGLKIVDTQGRTLSNGNRVLYGQTLKASINSPNANYGWKFSKCQGKSINNKEVFVVITGNPGDNAVIAYGDKTKQQGRQRLTLKIVEPPSYGNTSSGIGGEPDN